MKMGEDHYLDKKRYAEAEAECKRAITLDATRFEPHYGLGRLYANEKRYVEAETEYKEAIALDATSFEPHNNLGCIYLSQKRYEEALREFEKALRIQPDNTMVRQNYDLTLKRIKGE